MQRCGARQIKKVTKIRDKHVLLFLLLLALLLAGCGTEKKEENIPAYLVAVSGQGIYGTGIIYSVDKESLNVLTAAHVVESAQADGNGLPGSESAEDLGTGRVVVRFCDGCELVCEDIVVSETADVAMLRISVSGISEEQRQRYQCVQTDKESFDRLNTGDSCTAVGMDAKAEVVRYEGSILEPWIYMEDYGQYMIWANAGIQPGMSGGGLFDGRGYFIGLLSGGNEDEELAAVPLSLILQFDMDVSGGLAAGPTANFRKLLYSDY